MSSTLNRHVQINSDKTLDLYKNFGFKVIECKKQYYKHSNTSDAFALSQKIDKNQISSFLNEITVEYEEVGQYVYSEAICLLFSTRESFVLVYIVSTIKLKGRHIISYYYC